MIKIFKQFINKLQKYGIIIKMPCPKCGNNNIILGGKYKIKRTHIVIQRFRCKSCRHSFIRRTKTYRKRIPFKIRNEIIKLYRTKKPYKNKFNGLKKQTFSTREIARRLNVSKSFVHKIIKENYNQQ